MLWQTARDKEIQKLRILLEHILEDQPVTEDGSSPGQVGFQIYVNCRYKSIGYWYYTDQTGVFAFIKLVDVIKNKNIVSRIFENAQ